MDYFYFDASALAKRYANEVGTEAVNQILDRVDPTRLMCLIIGTTEVVSVLVRKRNDGQNPVSGNDLEVFNPETEDESD